MPFTPAHAVVALPFVRTPLVPAAIAIGAMAPDIPLFFRIGPGYWVTHDWPGVFSVDVLIAFALLLVWRMVLRPAVIPLTPRWFARRWPREWLTTASSNSAGDGWWSLWGGRRAPLGKRVVAGVVLVASIVLGGVTHVVWDAFTHTNRWGTHLIPFLDERTGPFYNADIAHWTSSIVGLGIIALWGFRWLGRQDAAPLALATPTWARVAVWLSLPLSLLVGAAVALRAGVTGARLFVHVAGTTGAAMFLVILAISALLVARKEARHARDAR